MPPPRLVLFSALCCSLAAERGTGAGPQLLLLPLLGDAGRSLGIVFGGLPGSHALSGQSLPFGPNTLRSSAVLLLLFELGLPRLQLPRRHE